MIMLLHGEKKKLVNKLEFNGGKFMDGLMKLYKNERTNDYFKKNAIMQIEIAHRIKEYLDPDEYFPPKDICKSTMDLFLQKEVKKAVHRIFDEVSFDCDCSSNYSDVEREAVEFAEELLNEYLKKINKDLLTEREQLLIRLGEIDNQLN